MRTEFIFGLATALAVILGGCIMSGGKVLPVGPDTYSVAVDATSAAQAKERALGNAGQYCASLGKQLLVTNTQSKTALIDPNDASENITFRCLKPGDPELLRPTFQSAPNVVIENRNAAR